ncbi:MAG: 6-carboxytetrahydropterin synthase QueD [Planctomycetes bacterium]|nr:6-carboxytetrahydropterin synthase QueD [Planctomycetota bacterium]
MPYELIVKSHFSAAHNLRNYRGKCEHLHGHNWSVDVTLTGRKLDKTGMLVDFKVLKGYLKSVLDRYDHAYLNELPDFKRVNPTTENIAYLLHKKLQTLLRPKGLKVTKVCVWESPECGSCYNAM